MLVMILAVVWLTSAVKGYVSHEYELGECAESMDLRLVFGASRGTQTRVP
jgi:hypothetical protein